MIQANNCMSSDAIEPFDWSRRFFGLGRRRFFDDMFRGFDQMKREMEREFEDMEKRIPKDLIREYTTSEGEAAYEHNIRFSKQRKKPPGRTVSLLVDRSCYS